MVNYALTFLVTIQWLRLLYQNQGTKLLGPLVKMVRAMVYDFLVFCTFLVIVMLTFTCAGSILFSEMDQFSNFKKSLIYMFSICLGNFDYGDFDNLKYHTSPNVGYVYLTLYLIIANIMLLNLLIAILSDTYSVYTDKSVALYLREQILLRQKLEPHDVYGCLVSACPPFNLFIIPLVPI